MKVCKENCYKIIGQEIRHRDCYRKLIIVEAQIRFICHKKIKATLLVVDIFDDFILGNRLMYSRQIKDTHILPNCDSELVR